jgi:hypothetical protein
MSTSPSTLLENKFIYLDEIVDAPGNYGNASMPEQVKRPIPWRRRMMMMMMMVIFRQQGNLLHF